MFAASILALIVVFAVHRVLVVQRSLRIVGHLPRRYALFGYLSIPASVLPTNTLNSGLIWNWLWRDWFYRKAGNDTMAWIGVLTGDYTVTTASPEVAKQLFGGKTKIWKHPDMNAGSSLFGQNVLTVDFEDYKRHRRIVGPAFNNKAFELVWNETRKFYREMIDVEGWAGRDIVELTSANAITLNLAMVIIARCGFGLPFEWADSQDSGATIASDGQSLTLRQSLKKTCAGQMILVATPEPAYKLPVKALRDTKSAYNIMKKHMQAMVAERKTVINDGAERNDLFSWLVKANIKEMDNVNAKGLSDEELIGNVFVFLFAGHETTAHVLAATMGYLALNPDIQEGLFEHIKSAIGDTEPTFDAQPQLNQVLGCFLESARLLPPAWITIRDTYDDIVLNIDEADGTTTPLALPSGARVVLDMVGLHYNPKTFDNPEEYRPSRWYDLQHDADATMFGLGPRGCIGRRFAMAEGTCFLAMLLRDWRVEPKLRGGETPDEWRKRVMQGDVLGLAFGAGNIPVVLKRRGT